MAALRWPLRLLAEYRGVEAASQFTDRETGEVRDIPAKLKFEVETDGGDVQLLVVPASQLDKARPTIAPDELNRGDRVELSGVAVIQDRGSDRSSYVQITSAERAVSSPLRSSKS